MTLLELGSDYRRYLRRQIEKIQKPSPVQEALLDWYDLQGEEVQELFDQMLVELILGMKMRNQNQPFGPAMALELLGAIIAVKMGWKRARRV